MMAITEKNRNEKKVKCQLYKTGLEYFYVSMIPDIYVEPLILRNFSLSFITMKSIYIEKQTK